MKLLIKKNMTEQRYGRCGGNDAVWSFAPYHADHSGYWAKPEINQIKQTLTLV